MFDRFKKQTEIGRGVYALMETAKASRDEAEDIYCALLAQNMLRGRRQDEWPEAAIEMLERLRKFMHEAVRSRQIALANAKPGGSA